MLEHLDHGPNYSAKLRNLQEKRFYKLRSPAKAFFCALCAIPRETYFTRTLKFKHYLQILVLTAFVVLVLFPWMEWKTLLLLPFIWGCYEMMNKALYRREITCPHCGFDPTWYRRNVKVAKSKVQNFWKLQTQHLDGDVENKN